MSLSIGDFDDFHVAVHGKTSDGKERRPFDWQRRLLRQIVDTHAWPQVLDLPTGVGKTTCIDIALFALVLDAQSPIEKRWCPRRIAMVVDRRVVVDQAADRGHKLLRALVNPQASTIVRMVADRLLSLNEGTGTPDGHRDPIGVFTLRGGMPKDDGWARTPSQPLILASTVDQIGSRMLMRGYGVSPGMRPVHAGLLANDVLLLLDEVHLSQPFKETLEQLASLRGRFAATSPLPHRFHHTFLSATPGATNADTFTLTEDEKGPDTALGPRLHARKPASLFERTGRNELEQLCIDKATELIDKHEVVAVIVNRVASAREIARQLHGNSPGNAEVVLLTGRMRPLDRDDRLRDVLPRIATGRDRQSGAGKLIVVGTQCLEAGADFDFDAIVTEAASLDALRQRFGRVDRLGQYGATATDKVGNRLAEGVIVYDADKEAKDDPVYGESIAKTVTWLRKYKKKLDFGVLALPQVPDDQIGGLLAPKKSAPVLLPAYLDLWMQSYPKPAVVPDVSLWLHGPESGPADVQVLWRSDITDEALEAGASSTDGTKRLVSIVSAIRPSSLEAISLPIGAVRRWLRGGRGNKVQDDQDVEGLIESEDRATGTEPLLALRWEGDESEVISSEDLRPGDTIVVPAARGGIHDGCFDPEDRHAVPDLAERAAFFGRGQPVLRLHEDVLSSLELEPQLALDELQEVKSELSRLAKEADPGDWRRPWLEALKKARQSFIVDGVDDDREDQGWRVLRGQRLSSQEIRQLSRTHETLEDGIESTTDPDESSFCGRRVTLAEHCEHVEELARSYGTVLGFPGPVTNDLALAGWLHDVGKADRRFQILLRGGSEIEFFKDETPWAKSGMPPGAKAAHRRARLQSGYPEAGRHEVLSVHMLDTASTVLTDKAQDRDLVLHLIASHHGYCRPFAPVSIDLAPVQISLPGHESQTFGAAGFAAVGSDHNLHRIDSPLADRFWSLVEKYGWHELCWIEAVLRLADHRASEEEQEKSNET